MEAILALFFASFSIFFILAFIAIFVIAIGGTIFWIWAIIDVAKRDFKKKDDKTLWILIIVLTGVIGALIYYLIIVKKPKSELK